MTTHLIIILVAILVLLILLSAYFSSTETAMMALNRYRLKHRVREGDRSAKRVSDLLKKPDRLLGVILTGNTFANILASSIATLISVNYLTDVGALISSIILTCVILIFGEVAPKTIAAAYADRWAALSARPLTLLLIVMGPLVRAINFFANGFLRLFGFKASVFEQADSLSHDELRTIVGEAKTHLTGKYLSMLAAILDLQKLTINDIMIPRHDIHAIDLDRPWPEIILLIINSEYGRIPVYRGSFDNVQGILHVRDALPLMSAGTLNAGTLASLLQEAYFVPEATSLYVQMAHFQKTKRRSALVVNEYGDVQGLVTLEDILEEIVGEFTTDASDNEPMVVPDNEGAFIVKGDENIRELNRLMKWSLPMKDAKTLNGLIVHHLQDIPSARVCVKIHKYRMDVLEIKENVIAKVKIMPQG